MGKKKRKSFGKDKHLSDDDTEVKIKRKRLSEDKKRTDDDVSSDLKDMNKSKGTDLKEREEFSQQKNIEVSLPLEDRIIDDSNDGKIYIALEAKEEISFIGKVKLKVVFGSVSVLGFEIKSSEKSHNLYSPNCNSFLTIVNIHGKTCTKLDTIDEIDNLDTRTRLNSVVKTSSCSSVIELNQLDQAYLNFVTSFNQFQQLFTGTNKYGYKDSIEVGDIGVEIIRDTHANAVTVTEDYLHIKERVLRYIEEGCANVTVAFCGGKNAGKSTFGRYMINTLLNKTSAVAFLECDIGQSEFTPSGCISLHIVDKPVLGPPFTHIRQPEKCCFYGSLSPGDNPREYLKCVQQIYQQYTSQFKHLPLLVNTMGWNKGIGLSLLVDTLKLTQPDFLIQLDTPYQSRNLPPMRPKAFGSDLQEGLPSFDESEKWEPSYQLIIIQTASISPKQIQEKFKAVDHRTLSLMSYLGRLCLVGGYLTNVQPYSVPWGSVAVWVPSVVPSQVMHVLNCSVVGLCCVDENKIKKSDSPDMPRFLKSPPRSGCVGLGVIRAIDPVKKLYFIITPVPGHVLQTVNAMVRGALDVPQQILLKQKSSGGIDVPYTGTPKDTIGATSIKPRRHMGRHYKQLPEKNV